MNLFDLSWKCDICKEERPDAAISVAHRPLRGMEDMFPATRFNLKFCNDKAACIEQANKPGPWPEKEKKA